MPRLLADHESAMRRAGQASSSIFASAVSDLVITVIGRHRADVRS
jgi:hypothetical protein